MKIEDATKPLEDAVLDGELDFFDAQKRFALAVIGAVLKRHKGNMTKTAEDLGVHRTSLQWIIKRKMFTHKGYLKRKKREPLPRKVEEFCPKCKAVLNFSTSCFGCAAVRRSIALMLHTS